MKYVIAFALAGTFILFLSSVGGKIEGRYFPVVSQADISRVERVGQVATRFWGSFEKLRDCTFEDLKFYLGDPTASARADFEFEEVASVRHQGDENFGPWLVQLTPDQLTNRSFAVAKHKCHPLWLTETIFYQGE